MATAVVNNSAAAVAQAADVVEVSENTNSGSSSMPSTREVENNAVSNAIFLLQKQLFELQSQQVADSTAALQSNPQALSSATFKMPQFLLSRRKSADVRSVYAAQSQSSAAQRFIDDEEITMLSLLDSDGCVSLTTKMEAFMVVMTRIRFSDHRVLCLHLLIHHLTDSTRAFFVAHGGYKIIERWLQIAKDSGSLGELRTIIQLCGTLPFDVDMAKQSGIAKAVNKLHSKLKTMAEHQELTAQVSDLLKQWRSLHEEWKEKKQRTSGNRAPNGDGDKLQKLDGKTKDLVDALVDRAQTRIAASVAVESYDDAAADVMDVTASIPAATEEAVAAASAPTENIPLAEPSVPAVRAGAVPLLQAIKNSKAAQNTAAEAGNDNDVTGAPKIEPSISAAGAVNAAPIQRKPIDLRETARKMRALQQHLGASTVADPEASSNQVQEAQVKAEAESKYISSDLVCSEYGVQNLLKIDLKAPPLERGGIKRPRPHEEEEDDNDDEEEEPPADSNNEGSDGAVHQSKKFKKRKIRFADAMGMPMHMVHIIEVDRIRRKTATYTSTKELSKREKMEEKKAHISKINDSMQTNTTWKRPTKIALPLDVVEFSASGADSDERTEQTERLAHVLEARYYTESAIPSDPYAELELSQSGYSNGSNTSSSSGFQQEESIPWYSKDTQPPPEDFYEPAQLQTGISASSITSMPSSYAFSHGLGNNVADPMAMAAPHSGENELQSLIADLPLSLQMLDPHALQVIINDPTILQSLLRADGSVDDAKVAEFQRNVHLTAPHGHGIAQLLPQNTEPPHGNASLRRKSRWGSASDSSATAAHGAAYQVPTYHGDAARVVSQYGPSAIDLTGYEYPPPHGQHMQLQQPQQHQPGLHEFPQTGVGSDMLPYGADPRLLHGAAVGATDDFHPGAVSGAHHPFPSKKAATPCRFFNTPAGCHFGDKCQFGHFMGMPVDMAPSHGGGPGRGRGRGPGARGGRQRR